jgi:hypothetical protein
MLIEMAVSSSIQLHSMHAGVVSFFLRFGYLIKGWDEGAGYRDLHLCARSKASLSRARSS